MCFSLVFLNLSSLYFPIISVVVSCMSCASQLWTRYCLGHVCWCFRLQILQCLVCICQKCNLKILLTSAGICSDHLTSNATASQSYTGLGLLLIVFYLPKENWKRCLLDYDLTVYCWVTVDQQYQSGVGIHLHVSVSKLLTGTVCRMCIPVSHDLTNLNGFIPLFNCFNDCI